jgi:hypothetical protein
MNLYVEYFLLFFCFRLQSSCGGKFAAKNFARKMSTEPSCIFCQIAQRSAPAKILYEVSHILKTARKIESVFVPLVRYQLSKVPAIMSWDQLAY